MSEPIDPFEILARLRPPRLHEGPLRPGEDPTADAMLHEIQRRLATGSAAPRRERRSWRRLFGGLVTVGLIGGASVAVAVWYEVSRPDHDRIVSCWSDTEPVAQWETRIAVVASPIDACHEPWSNGDFGEGGPPPLVACVTETGITAVVPGDDTICDDLGVPRLDPAHETDDVETDADVLHRLLVARLAERCADEGDTLELIHEVIDDTTFADWTIEYAARFSDERPCGQVSIDPTTRTIHIAPLPHR